MEKNKQTVLLLVKINPWSIVGDLQYPCRATNQNCAVDRNGQEARKHDDDLEYISPDHGFHATLLGIMGETDRKTEPQHETFTKN